MSTPSTAPDTATTAPHAVTDWTQPSVDRLAALHKLQLNKVDIPHIDPSDADHNLLPQWINRFPLFFTIELVNRGVCVYCLLRFLMQRSEDYYTQSPDVTIASLFSEYVTSTVYSTPEVTKEIQDTFVLIKEKLINTANNAVCTICFNILTPSQSFIDFMVNTVHEADYEFNTYHIQRTLPSIISLKQFGMWHYLKHQFGTYIPYLVQNPTTEATIVEIKECFKLQIPQYTKELNKHRNEFNTNSTIQLEPSPITTTNDTNNTNTISPPTAQSLIQSNECNFVTSRRKINKDPITFDTSSPFHIDITFYSTSPEFGNTLHNLLYKRDLYGEFSTSSNVFKSMSAMGLANMKVWGLSPPVFTPPELIPLPTPLHSLIPQNERDGGDFLESNGFYTPSYQGTQVNQSLPFLPKKCIRYPSVNEFNGRTFMINKYCFVQISCKHNPVFLQGNYCKRSRMLSQTSWYRDLSFYQQIKTNIPTRGTQEAIVAAQRNNQFAQPSNNTVNMVPAEDKALLDVLQVQILQDKNTNNNNNNNTNNSGMGDNGEAPVQYDPHRKRRNFEHGTEDEKRAQEKKERQLQGQGKKGRNNNNNNNTDQDKGIDPDGNNGSDADEIVSLHELDPLFTGNGNDNCNGDDDDDGSDADGPNFGAMLKQKIKQNKEREQRNDNDDQDNNDDDDNNTSNNNQGGKNNNNRKNNKVEQPNITKKSATLNDNPNEQNEDDAVGQGSLPYAESSVENELCCRILPYFHSVYRPKVGFNVISHPNDVENPNIIEQIQAQINTPEQLHNNIDTTIPAQRFAGYCSIHSTNPNGIPCTHYHREALPGPIDEWYQSQNDNENSMQKQQPKEIQFNPYRLMFHANFSFKFHSSGREDLNVRMLGDGRPFLIEIVDPHRIPTNLDLSKVLEEVNNHTQCCSLTSLEHADDATMDAMTKAIGEKRKQYRCVVHTKDPISKAILEEKIGSIGDVTITQNTPVRVLLRRAALPRQRNINNVKATYVNPHFFYLDLETQAGTYVKEFVHSDKGRTNPSISSILGTQCDILQLDVTGLIL